MHIISISKQQDDTLFGMCFVLCFSSTDPNSAHRSEEVSCGFKGTPGEDKSGFPV